MAGDPNWLFSSTAQSAAAVFAIVGGFIATRVLNVASERRSVEQQVEELRQRSGDLQRRIDNLKVERYAECLRLAFYYVKDDAKHSGRMPPFQDVLKATASVVFDGPSLQAEYDRLSEVLAKAEDFVATHTSSVRADSESFNLWVHELGVLDQEDQLDWELLEAAYLRAVAVKRGDPNSEAATYLAPTTFNTPSRLTEIDDEVRSKQVDMQGLDSQISILDRRKAEAVLPHGIGWSFLILFYIGAVSVVLPLALMPATEVSDWLRALTVGLFAAGLLALMVYMALLLRPAREWWRQLWALLGRESGDK